MNFNFQSIFFIWLRGSHCHQWLPQFSSLASERCCFRKSPLKETWGFQDPKVNQEVFGLAVPVCWGRHVEGVCCACFGQSDMWGWNIWTWVKGWYFWNMISVKTGETVMTPHYLQREGQNERICRRKMQVFLIYIKWEKCRALKEICLSILFCTQSGDLYAYCIWYHLAIHIFQLRPAGLCFFRYVFRLQFRWHLVMFWIIPCINLECRW